MATDLNGVFARESIPLASGKELVLTLQSFETEAKFKEYLEREALAGFMRKRDMLGDAEYAKICRAVGQDFASRAYAWGKPAWQECLNDLENNHHLFFLVFTQKQLNGENSPNLWLQRDMMGEIWRELDYEDADEQTGQKKKKNRLIDAWERLNAPNPKAPSGRV